VNLGEFNGRRRLTEVGCTQDLR